MQISNTVHALRIEFQIPLPDNRFLNRFVYAYLINNDKMTLIDAGVMASVPIIIDYIKTLGKSVEDISDLILTHAHPDHIGGAKEIQSLSGCTVHAHIADCEWTENIDKQFKERPVPGFYNLVGGSVTVNKKLNNNEIVNSEIRVLHTPGHSDGHIALLYEKENIIFSGDAIPMKNDMPIYSDPQDTIESIKKIKSIPGVQFLLSSWDSPRSGNDILNIIEDGIQYIRMIHEKVLEERKNSDDLITTARNTWKRLGLPEFSFNPLFVKTIEGHLRYNIL